MRSTINPIRTVIRPSHPAADKLPRRRRGHHLLLAPLLVLIAANAWPPAAFPAEAARPRQANPTIDPILVAAGFLDSHPDLLYRSRGLDAYGEKKHAEAYKQFKRAAYYSDKPSQAIIGEMLWIGLGADIDRALAYVWMELAAERGYLSFREKRDSYWAQLDEFERARAEMEGPAIRAEYSDTVAEPRLAQVLVREHRKLTGSRLGSQTSAVRIVIPGVGSIDSTQYYNPKYWEPGLYRDWQDSIWTDLRVRPGHVRVGDAEQVGDAFVPPSNPEPDSP